LEVHVLAVPCVPPPVERSRIWTMRLNLEAFDVKAFPESVATRSARIPCW
jgi:hypothetical protein